MGEGATPADLIKAGQSDPKVADFLNRLNDVLLDEVEGETQEDTANGVAPASGLDAIRESVSQSVSSHDNNNAKETTTTIKPPTTTPSATMEYMEMANVVKEELQDTIKPELLNRIDEIVVFSPLSNRDITGIATLLLEESIQRAKKERDITLQIEPSLIQKIVQEGSRASSTFGARPMRRAVQRYFEDTVSESIIRQFLKDGHGASVRLGAGANAVEVVRGEDGEVMSCFVDENHAGGIGSSSGGSKPASKGVNGEKEERVADEPLKVDAV